MPISGDDAFTTPEKHVRPVEDAVVGREAPPQVLPARAVTIENGASASPKQDILLYVYGDKEVRPHVLFTETG
jgi:hypothetical protein